MFDRDNQQNTNRANFVSSMNGLSICIGLTIMLFLAPWLREQTLDPISNFVWLHYGEAMGDLIIVAYSVLLWPTTYFLARATVSTMIMTGALAAAVRFL